MDSAPFTKHSYNKSDTKNNSDSQKEKRAKEMKPKNYSYFKENDYSNNYIHSGILPASYVRNTINPREGYPKLDKLHELKERQIGQHATNPYGARVRSNQIIPTLNMWIEKYRLQFDVIMIGALVENQFILPLFIDLPIYKLCAKPGFVFIWATTQKIQELSILLNNEGFAKKFRRSEELIFLPLGKDSPYYPHSNGHDDMGIPLLERQQWHCWMCITGTVRRSSDSHLIHCNVDTDLQLESREIPDNNAVPSTLYKVAENFSNSNRRLHIIPTRVGSNIPIKLRQGWVIMSPDVLLDNFDPVKYEIELRSKSIIKYRSRNNVSNPQYLVPQTSEIEEIRPKSPATSKSQF